MWDQEFTWERTLLKLARIWGVPLPLRDKFDVSSGRKQIQLGSTFWLYSNFFSLGSEFESVFMQKLWKDETCSNSIATCSCQAVDTISQCSARPLGCFKVASLFLAAFASLEHVYIHTFSFSQSHQVPYIIVFNLTLGPLHIAIPSVWTAPFPEVAGWLAFKFSV